MAIAVKLPERQDQVGLGEAGQMRPDGLCRSLQVAAGCGSPTTRSDWLGGKNELLILDEAGQADCRDCWVVMKKVRWPNPRSVTWPHNIAMADAACLQLTLRTPAMPPGSRTLVWLGTEAREGGGGGGSPPGFGSTLSGLFKGFRN